MALDTIPKQEGGKLKAVASGTLPSGQPVVVNADGTVSVVAVENLSENVGTAAAFDDTTSASEIHAIYDSSSQKVVVSYRDGLDSTRGYAAVGTVSGNSISFGTPVRFTTRTIEWSSCTYDSVNSKVVIAYADQSSPRYGYAIVGDVSGTSISFGSETVFNAYEVQHVAIGFDEGAGKVVIVYEDWGNSNYGLAIVGTVSGTSISFGSEVVYESSRTQKPTVVYDANAQKTVICFSSYADSEYGQGIVGTVSGTSISFGTKTQFEAGVLGETTSTYDSNAQKIVVVYRDQSNSNYGTVAVGTVSGTSISFGTPVVFHDGYAQEIGATYDASVGKIVITYRDASNSSYGMVVTGTVSGTSVSFDTETVFSAVTTRYTSVTYDANAKKAVIAFKDGGGSGEGEALVYQSSGSIPNLTAENYIGMSEGVVEDSSVSELVGTSVVFETGGIADEASSAFDSNSNKTVIAYVDIGNGSEGTAVVGTVSGNAISFGSEVSFSGSGVSTRYIGATFDSSNNKIAIAYQDASNSQYGTAVVGTVSGTTISFGTPVVFESASCQFVAATFDNNSNKVVVAYADQGNVSGAGTAIVGTVSGTSISFGSPTVFENANTDEISIAFDSSANKVVVAYQDVGNSNHGTAAVGTVSGTSISFGTPVVFQAADTRHTSTTFDSTNNKIVIAYENDGSSEHGTAVVGTVSGTSISFGTPVVFAASVVSLIDATFDSNANKVVVQYRDETNSNYGTIVSGSVSGTTITFDTPLVFNANTSSNSNTNSFDSNANKVVIAYNDGGNSNKGTSAVYQTGYTDITRGQVASGGAATVDIVGTVSTNQLSLTAGQQYFVQPDGTLGLTAADPSVLAGTAISATKLVVKT